MRRITTYLPLSGFIALLVLAHAPAATAQDWTPYRNARFGVQADIPAGWNAGEDPVNGDGRTFTAPNGRATLSVWGHYQVLDSIKAELDMDAKPDEGETISYHQRNARSLTISGTHGDRIFYRRYLLTCHGTIWNALDLTYPASEQPIYTPMVAHIAKSLQNSTCGK